MTESRAENEIPVGTAFKNPPEHLTTGVTGGFLVDRDMHRRQLPANIYCGLHGILRTGFVLPAGNQCHDCKNHIDQTPAGPDFHSFIFLPIWLRM